MTAGRNEREINDAIVRFLTEIGLVCHEVPGVSGFAAGVLIVSGELHVDLDVVRPSTLLHEAGHLAVIPDLYRSKMSGDLHQSVRDIFEEVSARTDDPCHPVLIALFQASDTEVTAWAWAAGKHLGIPEDLIIEAEDYQNAGDDIALMLRMGRYAGIHGLTHAGFTQHSKLMAEMTGAPLYPKMRFWTQPACW